MSSHDAPASSIWGMLLSVPHRFSIRKTMRGTTTAGETAASTAPITAASMRLTPRRYGASSMYPASSQVAGRHESRTAGRPTCLRSDRLSDRPALSRMMISAICRSSDEIDRIESSSTFSMCGPRTMPTRSIPMIRGSLIAEQTAAAASPARKTRASDVNIVFLLPGA